MTTHADGLYQFGGMPVTPGVPVPFTGKQFWVDAVNGSDGNAGNKPARAFKSLYRALAACTSGNNDVVYLIGNGASTGSVRLSTANAQLVDPTATTGTLTWNKNATHLIGVSAPGVNSRARIATPTGTYLESTFNSLKFMEVTGSGCYFSNISLYQQFSTGLDGEVCLTVSGDYNVFDNVFVGGLQSAIAAQATAGRSVKLVSCDETWFRGCQIGTDTVDRTAANASVEFITAAARNRFTNCVFPARLTGSGTGAFFVLGTGSGCVDRHQIFERCMFLNANKSGSSTMVAALSFTTNAPGGYVLFKDCDTVGVTKLGDTNGLANSYVSNLYGAGTSGLDVNPS